MAESIQNNDHETFNEFARFSRKVILNGQETNLGEIPIGPEEELKLKIIRELRIGEGGSTGGGG